MRRAVAAETRDRDHGADYVGIPDRGRTASQRLGLRVIVLLLRTNPAPVTEYEPSMYPEPSRYGEPDKFNRFAATEFGNYLVRRRYWKRCPRGWAPGRIAYRATRSIARSTPPCRRERLLRLRAAGGAAAGREGAGPHCLAISAGAVSDGLPCGGRGVHRPAVEGG